MIRSIVPAAKLLLPVRDGRDVVASMAKRYGGELEPAIDRWISENELVLAERDRPGVCVVRYEDLIEDARATLTRICEFLGLEFMQELLEYHSHGRVWFGEQRIQHVSPEYHEAYRNWQINQPLFDGRGRWRERYAPDSMKRLLVGRGGRVMRAFGYLEDDE